MSRTLNASAGSVAALRERVIIEREERTADGAGGAVLTWTPVGVLWAGLRLMAVSKGQLADARPTAPATWRILIRYRPDVTAGMRFRLTARAGAPERIFRVLATEDEDGRRRYLRCACEEWS